MANKVRWLAVAATALAAGGCYPLEQAPLVYASKEQIGVHVTSGTTDTPGLDIVVGYKGLDIAMVPVAVAKYCEAADHKDCLNEIYRMQVIAGGRQDPLNTKDMAKRIDDLRRSVAANQRLLDANGSEIKAAEIKLARAERRIQLTTDITVLNVEALRLSPDQTDRAVTLAGEKGKMDKELAEYQDVAGLDVGKEQTRVGQLRARNTSLEADIKNDQERLTALEQQQQAAKAGSRADALSVYGTFTGNANGQANQASLSAGKVFATGVAAQYLAERAGTANCLASVALLAEKIKDDAAKRENLIAQAGALCMHRETEG